MTCKHVMNSQPPVLVKGATVADAVSMLRRENRVNLPVVDANGKYLGLFGAHQILLLALPKGMRADDEQHLAFVSDSFQDIENRLKAVANHPVERYMDGDFQPLTPDTPLVETLRVMYVRRDDLPVVDPATKKLVGIVTVRSSLGKLMAST
ncbi:MAG: CBS domain-containing protein [Rhodospirillales bacterium]|nr:CBS domain-containing protein [Rhodospirillales bacterium]